MCVCVCARARALSAAHPMAEVVFSESNLFGATLGKIFHSFNKLSNGACARPKGDRDE